MSTIAAIATAQAAAGIGVIRISGECAAEVADRVFKSVSGKKIEQTGGYKALFGKVCDGGVELDEAVRDLAPDGRYFVAHLAECPRPLFEAAFDGRVDPLALFAGAVFRGRGDFEGLRRDRRPLVPRREPPGGDVDDFRERGAADDEAAALDDVVHVHYRLASSSMRTRAWRVVRPPETGGTKDAASGLRRLASSMRQRAGEHQPGRVAEVMSCLSLVVCRGIRRKWVGRRFRVCRPGSHEVSRDVCAERGNAHLPRH